MDCCDNADFKLVEELGHAESVDFDLVQCVSCGAYAMRSWSEHRPGRVFYEPMTARQAGELGATQGLQRKQLLKAWFNDH